MPYSEILFPTGFFILATLSNDKRHFCDKILVHLT
jgi:hypothetical protein